MRVSGADPIAVQSLLEYISQVDSSVRIVSVGAGDLQILDRTDEVLCILNVQAIQDSHRNPSAMIDVLIAIWALKSSHQKAYSAICRFARMFISEENWDEVFD